MITTYQKYINYYREYNKNYMRKLRVERKKNKKCIICNKDLNGQKFLHCSSCLLKERKRNKKSWKKNEINELERGRVKAFKYKFLALQKICKSKIPFCVKCKTKDIRVLTINHKNGDGRTKKETGIYRGNFLIKIVKNKRKVDDLEVRCMNCNILYEYERGRFRLPKNFEEIIKGLII